MALGSGPIGIFDSGIGGLSVAREVCELLPAERILYLADTRFAPYGEKSPDFIAQRMALLSAFMVERGAKAIVVACNTATTSAIAALRAQFDVPIIGVEPGVKPAVEQTRSGVIGVLATPRTLQTNAFATLTERFSHQARVVLQPCPHLVHQVESLALDSAETRALVQSYLDPLLAQGADTIVLGCTHYNHLLGVIQEVAGHGVTIINTEIAVAREVARRLQASQLLSRAPCSGVNEFWSSGDLALFQRQMDCLWGSPTTVQSLSV